MPSKNPPSKQEIAVADAMACAQSFEYFLFTHVITLDTKKGLKRGVNGWPYIRKVAHALQNNKKIVILKSRQLMVSWILCAFALWCVLYKKNDSTIIVSRSGEVSNDYHTTNSLAGRILFIYNELPDHLRQKLLFNSRPCSISNPSISSSINMLNSSDLSGRGMSGTRALLDEHSYHEHSKDLFRSIAAGCENIVSVSTLANDSDDNQFWAIWADETNGWEHLELALEDNPEKNYKEECERLNNDPIAISLELDRKLPAKGQTKVFPMFSLESAVYSPPIYDQWCNTHNNILQGGLDLGYGDGTACVLGYTYKTTDDPRVKFHIFREYYDTNKTPRKVAEWIKSATLINTGGQTDIPAPYALYSDPSGKNTKTNGGQSDFADYAAVGITLSSGNNDVRLGISRIQIMLTEGTLTIDPSCQWLLAAIAKAQYPTSKIGTVTDYSKYKHDQYSHILDACRYALLGVSMATPEMAGQFNNAGIGDNYTPSRRGSRGWEVGL